MLDLSLASQGTQKNTNPPPVPRRRRQPVPFMREEEENVDNDEERTSLQYTGESISSCPFQNESTIFKKTPDNSRPSNISTMDILKSLEYLNLDDQGNEIKPPEIIAVLPKSNQNSDDDLQDDTVLTKRPFILNVIDNEVDVDNTSLHAESSVKNDFSTISDISSMEVPLHKKHFRKELSVSSVKSSESVLFKEGNIRRWGSWERLNVSSDSSPIDEKEISSTTNMEKDEIVDGIDLSEHLNPSQGVDITKEDSYVRICENRLILESVGEKEKPLSNRPENREQELAEKSYDDVCSDAGMLILMNIYHNRASILVIITDTFKICHFNFFHSHFSLA